MAFNIEKSNSLIEAGYKKVLSRMIEIYENRNNLGIKPNVNADATYQTIKNHYESMDIFAHKITKRLSENYIFNREYEDDIFLDADGKGCFFLKSNQHKTICEFFLLGRQSVAFDENPDNFLFQCSFYKGTQKYPYISFFDEVMNVLNENYFESIKQDYKILRSKDFLFNYDFLEDSNINIPDKNITDIKSEDDIKFEGVYYQNMLFHKREESQSPMEYFFDINKKGLEAKGIENFQKFESLLKEIKRNKKFFQSIGVLTDEKYTKLYNQKFIIQLIFKNQKRLLIEFPFGSSLNDITKTCIKTFADNATPYTIKDYMKNPEEILSYIEIMDY